MGWLMTHGQTRAELIRRLIKGWTNNKEDVTCLRHAVRGNVLWKVMETRPKDGRPPELWIGCDLLRCDPGYGWGYKDMTESTGPSYYTCPLSFLEMVPDPAFPRAEGWRERVREYHARGALVSHARVGDIVELECGAVPAVRIVEKRPLVGECLATGKRWRIPRRLVKGIRMPESVQGSAVAAGSSPAGMRGSP